MRLRADYIQGKKTNKAEDIGKRYKNQAWWKQKTEEKKKRGHM